MDVLSSRLRMQLTSNSRSTNVMNSATYIQRAHYTLLCPPSRHIVSTSPLRRSPSCQYPNPRSQQWQHQCRHSSFLHDSSTSPAKRQTQTVRETYLIRRGAGRREGDARSKISTLALNRDMSIPLETEVELDAQSASQESQERGQDDTSGGKSERRSIRPRSRRVLLLAGILLLPVIGGDLVDAVVPGLLGVIIYVAGSIKMAVNWLRSLGSEE